MERDICLAPEEQRAWQKAKADGKKWCNENGWEYYAERPLLPIPKEYAEGDTVYLAHIYAACMDHPRLKDNVEFQELIAYVSQRRVEKCLDPDYNPEDRKNMCSPQEFLDYWKKQGIYDSDSEDEF